MMSERMPRELLALASLALVAGAAFLSAQEQPAPGERALSEEIKRLPAVPAEKALETIEVANGFSLELVAAEPDVSDPVDACFDENGRMYVAEMRSYPYFGEPTTQNPAGLGKKGFGMVRLLEDADGDGRMEKSTVFADGLTWPTSVCCYNGGVFAIAIPDLWYFKDTNGDGVADIREIVYSGFDTANVQGVANNLKWSLDNRIYGAKGTNPANLSHRGKPLFSLGSSDFSFDPKTEELRQESPGSQFGHSMDDWGNRFVSSNSNHIQHSVFPYRYLRRNPYLSVSNVVRTVAKEGAAAPVFRRSPAEPWRIVRTRRRLADPKFANLPETERHATGFFTSATGVTIYRGDAYPEEYRGNAFIGDVGGNLVHRKSMTPSGASFVAERTENDREFIASTDTWFRPVNFVNAPDGTLYILDMYRETIEHPNSIPEDIKRHVDLESGHDQGRIWRLVGPDGKRNPVVKMRSMSAPELVAQIESNNAWNRETAQRLLWEREDGSCIEPLEKLVRESKLPLARAHALWTLQGLNSLTEELVLVGLRDPDPHVREQALRLCEPFAGKSSEVFDVLMERVSDGDYRVRLQAAFSVGELPPQPNMRLAALARVARFVGNDADLRTAMLSSVSDGAATLASILIDDGNILAEPQGAEIIGELARIVGTEKDSAGALTLLRKVTLQVRDPRVRQQFVVALGDGLARSGLSIPQVLSADGATQEVRDRVDAIFQEAASIAGNGESSLSERIAAARLLAYADFENVSQALAELLVPATPRELQVAAVRSLAAYSDPAVGELLLAAWKGTSPEVRRDVVDALVAREDRIRLLLDEVEAETIRPGEIERDKQELLQNHPNEEIRDRGRKLLGGGVSSDRKQVVAAYGSAATIAGDAERGKAIYLKQCSVCHKLGDVGHQVGPELASVSNKSPDDLLIAILDPNREAQPIYTGYTIVTEQGTLITGIIVAENETSLTLRRSEGKEDVVLRSNIEEMVSSGLSLMPVGLEKEITPEQMADLIAFVKTIQPASR